MGALHALSKEEHVFRKGLLVRGGGQIHIAAQSAGITHHKVGLPLDGRDVLKHRLTFVGIDAQGADHVNQRVGVNVFFVRVTPEDQF